MKPLCEFWLMVIAALVLTALLLGLNQWPLIVPIGRS